MLVVCTWWLPGAQQGPSGSSSQPAPANRLLIKTGMGRLYLQVAPLRCTACCAELPTSHSQAALTHQMLCWPVLRRRQSEHGPGSNMHLGTDLCTGLTLWPPSGAVSLQDVAEHLAGAASPVQSRPWCQCLTDGPAQTSAQLMALPPCAIAADVAGLPLRQSPSHLQSCLLSREKTPGRLGSHLTEALQRRPGMQKALLVLALLGVSMVISDGVLTAAASVMSAMSGLPVLILPSVTVSTRCSLVDWAASSCCCLVAVKSNRS